MRKYEIHYRTGGISNPTSMPPEEFRTVITGDRVDLHPEDSRVLAVFTDRGDRHEVTAMITNWFAVIELEESK